MGDGNALEANFPNALERMEVKCLAIVFPVIEPMCQRWTDSS